MYQNSVSNYEHILQNFQGPKSHGEKNARKFTVHKKKMQMCFVVKKKRSKSEKSSKKLF